MQSLEEIEKIIKKGKERSRVGETWKKAREKEIELETEILTAEYRI